MCSVKIALLVLMMNGVYICINESDRLVYV